MEVIKIELVNGIQVIPFQSEFYIKVGFYKQDQAEAVIFALNKVGVFEIEFEDLNIIKEISVKVGLHNATPIRNIILDVIEPNRTKPYSKL